MNSLRLDKQSPIIIFNQNVRKHLITHAILLQKETFAIILYRRNYTFPASILESRNVLK